MAPYFTDLESNEIGPEGAKALAGSIIQGSVISTLAIRTALRAHPGEGRNQVGAEGAKAVAKALLQSRSLAVLDMGKYIPGASQRRI